MLMFTHGWDASKHSVSATIHPGLWGKSPFMFTGGLVAVKTFGRKAAF